MATTRDRDLDRLAHYVTKRRHDLGKGRQAIASTVGLAKGTWTRLENGEPIREQNYAKADKALGWAQGSCVTVAEGGEPVLLRELGPDHYEASVPDDPSAEVRDSVTQVSLAVTDNLTAKEIRELSDRVAADLKRRGVI